MLRLFVMRRSAQARTGELWTWDEAGALAPAAAYARARQLLSDPEIGAVAVWDGDRFTTWRRAADVPETL